MIPVAPVPLSDSLNSDAPGFSSSFGDHVVRCWKCKGSGMCKGGENQKCKVCKGEECKGKIKK